MPDLERRRPDPDRLLKQVEAQERNTLRGHLKIFLGYASGVGKSLRMLEEGRRRKLRGQDVVVAATQACSPEVQRILETMEVIPPRIVNGCPAIDLDALLRRHPGLCLIDGLAYKNPPGSKHPHRWQDVEELRAAGISVVTSINIQYIAERQREIEAIRGKTVSDSVPEAFIQTADEIEVVDATPEYCAAHSIEGDEQRQLSELREIALVLAADVVDHQLEEYLQHQGSGTQLYGTQERILVCVTPRSSAKEMIHRARRQADRFHGDLYVVYVEQDNLNEADQRLIRENLDTAHEAKARVELLTGEDATEAILDFAASHGITQIFVGHSNQTGWASRLRANPVERLIMEADGIDVRIFPSVAV
jgi:two-component system sensor histidine kinase KdpD